MVYVDGRYPRELRLARNVIINNRLSCIMTYSEDVVPNQWIVQNTSVVHIRQHLLPSLLFLLRHLGKPSAPATHGCLLLAHVLSCSDMRRQSSGTMGNPLLASPVWAKCFGFESYT